MGGGNDRGDRDRNDRDRGDRRDGQRQDNYGDRDNNRRGGKDSRGGKGGQEAKYREKGRGDQPPTPKGGKRYNDDGAKGGKFAEKQPKTQKREVDLQEVERTI